MKRVLSVFVVFGILLMMHSCDVGFEDDGVNFYFDPFRVTSAELPESLNLNESYEFDVTYLRNSDCAFFQGFDVVNLDDTTLNITVIGTVITDQECNSIDEMPNATFEFTPTLNSRSYLFRFWSGESENGEQQYLEIEVPINPTSIN
ncbi:MAG: hypothetical protein AAGB24_02610 [Bacteroidota bacterium]